ncbi:MAG TPA: HupE/UreJ family protein [Verrucomicrobiota bacterium]|nr:Ni/Fe hydrogenase [Verrucomicrobiales bacterium]HRI12489.1 HupE/UreJ family protein [Verrucomicrobiota bacterium]
MSVPLVLKDQVVTTDLATEAEGSVAFFRATRIAPALGGPKANWITFAARVLVFLILPATASAHTETGVVGGFLSGFKHPMSGLDHLVAMVAVGIWGVFLGGRAVWILPVVFPVVMAFGGAAGIMGLPLPGVETGIALSAIVLGLMVALAVKPRLWIAAVIVGIFAIFHGYAHGKELPRSDNALAYAIGFVIATGVLHLAGIAFGELTRWPKWEIAVRACGGVIAAVGVAFLFGWL